MKKLFSWFMLLGIFFFGVAEWSRSLHQNFESKIPSKDRLVMEYASFPGGISKSIPRRSLGNISTNSSINLATQFLEENRGKLGLKEYHEFRPAEFKTPLSTHVRFSVYERGTLILNVGIEVEIQKDKTVKLVDNQYWDLQPSDSTQAIPLPDLVSRYRGEYRLDDSSLSEQPLLSAVPGSSVPELVYVFNGKDGSGKQVQLMVRASDGRLAGKLYSRAEFK
jgi:hypothetical protein